MPRMANARRQRLARPVKQARAHAVRAVAARAARLVPKGKRLAKAEATNPLRPLSAKRFSELREAIAPAR